MACCRNCKNSKAKDYAICSCDQFLTSREEECCKFILEDEEYTADNIAIRLLERNLKE